MPCEALLGKRNVNFAALSAAANFFKVCTFRLQNKAFFQRCIILYPRSQTLATLQYNLQFMWKTDDTEFVVRPGSFRCFAFASYRAISLPRFRSHYSVA